MGKRGPQPERTETIWVRVTPAQKEWLAQVATSQNTSVSHLVGRYINTMKAWSDIKDTPQAPKKAARSKPPSTP